MKKIINGQDSKIIKNNLFLLKKQKENRSNEKKFNWEPKLSDFNITDKISNISEFEINENSKCLKISTVWLIPYEYKCIIEFKWYVMLSASLIGSIVIRKKIDKTKIKNITFASFIYCANKFLIFNWISLLFLKIKLTENVNLKISKK